MIGQDVYRRAEKRSHFIADESVVSGAVVAHWIDSTHFWYCHHDANGREYRFVDAVQSMQFPLFDHRELAAALSALPGANEIAPHALTLPKLKLDRELNEIRFSLFGKHWTFSLDSGELNSHESRLPPLHVLSPDGQRAAFVRDFNLWVHEVATGEETPLTSDGVEHFGYGVGPQGRWAKPVPGGGVAPVVAVWSPDSTRVLTVRFDERLVRTNPTVDYAPADGSTTELVHEARWARPGDAHVPEAHVYAIGVASKQVVVARYNTIPAVRMLDGLADIGLAWWSDDSDHAWMIDVERGEQQAHVVAFDTSTGHCRRVFSEKTRGHLELGASVYLRTNVHPVRHTHELIWPSERSGQSHLFLYDLADGAMKRQLTRGSWRVVDVVHVDSKRRVVFFTASNLAETENPYDRVLCKVSLDGGEPQVLTPESGDHDVLSRCGLAWMMLGMIHEDDDQAAGISPDGDFFVDTFGSPGTPLTSVLRNAAGELVMPLHSTDVSTLGARWTWPEPFSAMASDGKTVLRGLLLRPADFDLDRKYPVIDHIYGGPQTEQVPKTALRMEDRGTLATGLALTELGFVVVLIDGRGTTGRSREFHEHSYGAVQRASDIDDHVAVIEQLAGRHAFLDLARVGITGFSGGGYATAHAMLSRPDFFKVGVASSGNYDQRVFWHGWGERYHGRVDGANYDDQSLTPLAKRLEGKLLFTHGLLDGGCVLAGLFQLTQALQDAHKDFDVVLEPRKQHELGGFGLRKTWDFFIRHLAGEMPPPAAELRTGFELLTDRAKRLSLPLEVDKT